MPLNKEDKKSIIKYRVEKAHKTMIEARDCATMGHWTLAANRLYYTLKSKHHCVSIRYNNTLTIRKCNRGGCDKQA